LCQRSAPALAFFVHWLSVRVSSHSHFLRRHATAPPGL